MNGNTDAPSERPFPPLGAPLRRQHRPWGLLLRLVGSALNVVAVLGFLTAVTQVGRARFPEDLLGTPGWQRLLIATVAFLASTGATVAGPWLRRHGRRHCARVRTPGPRAGQRRPGTRTPRRERPVRETPPRDRKAPCSGSISHPVAGSGPSPPAGRNEPALDPHGRLVSLAGAVRTPGPERPEGPEDAGDGPLALDIPYEWLCARLRAVRGRGAADTDTVRLDLGPTGRLRGLAGAPAADAPAPGPKIRPGP
ncbi:hypothetical protein OG422_25700 [Streptomyces sp. NBC_01525]